MDSVAQEEAHTNKPRADTHAHKQRSSGEAGQSGGEGWSVAGEEVSSIDHPGVHRQQPGYCLQSTLASGAAGGRGHTALGHSLEGRKDFWETTCSDQTRDVDLEQSQPGRLEP